MVQFLPKSVVVQISDFNMTILDWEVSLKLILKAKKLEILPFFCKTFILLKIRKLQVYL